MVGSAVVLVAGQGGVVVPHQVIMMAATTDQHLKVHLLEIIWLLVLSFGKPCVGYSFRFLVLSFGNNEAMIGL